MQLISYLPEETVFTLFRTVYLILNDRSRSVKIRQSYKTSLSKLGEIRSDNQTYFLVLINVYMTSKSSHTPRVHNIVGLLDGPVIVHVLKPIGTDNFEDNVQQVFLPYVTSQLHVTSKIEVIWDEYKSGGHNCSVPEMRRNVTRSSFATNTKNPLNLQEILNIDALLTLCHRKWK